jgi:hypothetical protein
VKIKMDLPIIRCIWKFQYWDKTRLNRVIRVQRKIVREFGFDASKSLIGVSFSFSGSFWRIVGHRRVSRGCLRMGNGWKVGGSVSSNMI